jgi:GT2 family glycosyltransferase
VPLNNTPEKFLMEMIDSVRNQTYKDWELCLSDGSDEEHVFIKNICEKLEIKDKRIRYKKPEKNLGISGNTNVCIDMATGDYIGLLDHGDLLHPSALFEVMKVICEKDADFVYTDEDKVDEETKNYSGYHFKPDFAIDNLRAYNYICHFAVFAKSLLDKVGKFDSNYDGAQDYDMALRLVENAKCIVHIPGILYHNRVQDRLNVYHSPGRDNAEEGGIRAVQKHLERCGLKGAVTGIDPDFPGGHRIRYELSEKPLVSILIPNKDHIEDLEKCLKSILELTSYSNYEIVVIENNSELGKTFQYYEEIKKYNNARVIIFDEEFNYSKITNFGMKYVTGTYVVLLNNDIEIISPHWIEEMLMFCQRDDVGAVGAKLYYRDNTIQHGGIILGIRGVAGHAHRSFPKRYPGYFLRLLIQQDLSAVTAACMMIKRSVFDEINGFNTALAVAFNDVDFCMRIRKAGYLIVWTPYAEAYHHELKSRGLEETPEKQARFRRESELFQKLWAKELVAGDPYYNRNLTLEKEDFSFAYDYKSIVTNIDNTEKNEEQMTIAEKLDIYYDSSNYERVYEVTESKKKFTNKPDFTGGLSIVILNLDKPELIIPLLENLIKAKHVLRKENIDIEIIVGDTGSYDESVLNIYTLLEKEISVRHNMVYHFSACNNELFKDFVTKEMVLFLNNDVIFSDIVYSLKSIYQQFLQNPNIGIVGSYLFYPDTSVQHMGIDFFKDGEAKSLCYHPDHGEKIVMPEAGSMIRVPGVTGACLTIRSTLFYEADGFDEMYKDECQDVSLCLSILRLGYEIVCIYLGNVIHLENATRPKNSENWRDRRRFLRKWKSYIESM